MLPPELESKFGLGFLHHLPIREPSISILLVRTDLFDHGAMVGMIPVAIEQERHTLNSGVCPFRRLRS